MLFVQMLEVTFRKTLLGIEKVCFLMMNISVLCRRNKLNAVCPNVGIYILQNTIWLFKDNFNPFFLDGGGGGDKGKVVKVSLSPVKSFESTNFNVK